MDAAGALYEIWFAENSPSGKRHWPDFSQHLSRREERAAITLATSDFAEKIFTVVRTLGDADKSDAEQQYAIALAVVGLGLPHGTSGQ